MKKIIFILFLLVLIFYQQIIPYNKLIFNTIIFSFVPSLLPCLLIVNFILELDILEYLYSKLYKNKLGRIIYLLILIIICITLGMPSLQIVLKKQEKKNILSLADVNKIIYSFGTISFPFIYGVCLINISDYRIIIYSLIIYFVLNMSLLMMMNIKINKINIIIEDKDISKALSNSINTSLKTIFMIVCVVLLFSLNNFFLEKIPYNFKYLLEGLFEFSYPCYQASKNNLFIIMNFLFLFPSFSIVIQSRFLNKDLDIKKYLLYRFIIALIGCLLFYCTYQLPLEGLI